MANGFITFLKNAAPWTAGALAATVPGPIGMVAGIVAKALNKPELVSKPDNTAVLNSLEPLMNTEEGRLQLAQIEQSVQQAFNQMKITELNVLIQMEQVESADRADARQMEGKDKWPPRLLTVYVCLVSTVVVVAVIRGWMKGVDALTAGMIGTVIGAVLKEMAQVINFWLGSSSGSDEKNAIIANLTANGNGNH